MAGADVAAEGGSSGAAVVRLSRDEAIGVTDPLTVDGWSGSVVVLDGVGREDDADLGWCRRACSVVVAVVAPGTVPPQAADVVIGGDGAAALLERILEAVAAAPQASQVLIDVLRAMPADVDAGLTLESLAYSMLLAGPDHAAWLADRPAPRQRHFASESVRLEQRGGELHIVLSRPENRNAFSAAMRDGLFEALALPLVDHTIGTVVLRGDGPVLSSGGDLSEFGTAPDVVAAHRIRSRRSVAALLHRLAARTTVEVTGACVGAGVELSAFAGRVVAHADATFRLPEVGMGLIPGAGGTVSLSRRIGRQETARLALLGEPIGAVEARSLGLVDEVVG